MWEFGSGAEPHARADACLPLPAWRAGTTICLYVRPAYCCCLLLAAAAVTCCVWPVGSLALATYSTLLYSYLHTVSHSYHIIIRLNCRQTDGRTHAGRTCTWKNPTTISDPDCRFGFVDWTGRTGLRIPQGPIYGPWHGMAEPFFISVRCVQRQFLVAVPVDLRVHIAPHMPAR